MIISAIQIRFNSWTKKRVEILSITVHGIKENNDPQITLR